MDLETAIAQTRLAARRRHALWNADDFDELCTTAWDAVAALDPVSRGAWLRLAAEPLPSVTLRACLRAADRLLMPVSAPARLGVLADLFNLCDGLCSGESWFDPFIASQLDGLGDLSDLPALVELALSEALEPVVSPAEPGALRPTCVRPDQIDPLFVPGEMRLIAPRVVAVRDRRREVEIGIFLGGPACAFGPVSLAPDVESPAPQLELAGSYGVRRVGTEAQGHGIDWIHLSDATPVHTHLSVGPYIVLAPVDSQRLWCVQWTAA
jgi:hypothetical protein